MLHQFTAAAERALQCASGWTNHTDCDELEAVPLLVGLLSEPECRAATMLARLAIDLAAVRRRWPTLAETEPLAGGNGKMPLSREVDVSLQLARQRLATFSQPPEMATEHILLGLAAADHELALWLRQQGLDPDALEAEILRLYGCRPEPWKLLEFEEAAGDMENVAPLGGRSNAGQESRLGPFWPAPPRLPDEIDSADVNNSETPVDGAAVDPSIATLRILDTAANRAREGLRVVEDYVRFVLDDRHLTQLCKQLRHDLGDALRQVPAERRLAARETQADVGTVLTTATEQHRSDAAEVLAANFARLQEALRSLEEFGKLVDSGLAAASKQLRYRTYTVERAVEITRGSIERLASARLYVLVDGRPSIEEFERLARGLIDAGADAIQLRDKQLGDRELLERARLLRSLTQGTGTLLVINDRPDLAVLAQADGVHVGQEDLSVKDARSIVGANMLVGVSAHSIEQARQAVLDGANYIGVGPTFPSGTKRFARFPGLELLRAVAAEIRLPAFAIGGIDRRNLAEVLAAGFTRVAVSGAITSAADPIQAAKELFERLLVPSAFGRRLG
jgi:thiamine-phosphate pyrophosphorylase